MIKLSKSDLILLFLFFVLAFLTIGFRSRIFDLFAGDTGAFLPDYHQTLNVCIDAGRPCLRVMTSLAGLAIEGLYSAIAELFYWNTEASPFFRGSPWRTHDPGEARVLSVIVPVSAYVSFVLVMLLPVLATGFRLFRAVPVRVLYFLAVFSVLAGWHPVLINLWFDFAAFFADWPRSYYIFQRAMNHYDFGAIAVLSLSLLYLARPGRRSLMAVAGFAVFAQATIEHLGLVFVFAVFFAALARHQESPFPRSVRAATIEAGAAVAGAVAAAIVLSAVFLLLSNGAAGGDATGFLSDRWSTTVQNNLEWIKTISANVISMVVLPVLSGIAIGSLSGAMGKAADSDRATSCYLVAMAGGGLVVGYLFTVVVGIFFISYPSEMGRQIAPLAVLTVVPAAKTAELLVLKWRVARESRSHAQV